MIGGTYGRAGNSKSLNISMSSNVSTGPSANEEFFSPMGDKPRINRRPLLDWKRKTQRNQTRIVSNEWQSNLKG